MVRAVLNYPGMAYQRRGSATPNVIKLTFDFDTLDRLKAEAAVRKVDTTRCAYELIQEALGARAAVAAADPADAAAPAFDWNSVPAFKSRDSR